MRYVHAACIAPSSGPPKPCFDSYMGNRDGITEEYIMNHIYDDIDARYDVDLDPLF